MDFTTDPDIYVYNIDLNETEPKPLKTRYLHRVFPRKGEDLFDDEGRRYKVFNVVYSPKDPEQLFCGTKIMLFVTQYLEG